MGPHGTGDDSMATGTPGVPEIRDPEADESQRLADSSRAAPAGSVTGDPTAGPASPTARVADERIDGADDAGNVLTRAVGRGQRVLARVDRLQRRHAPLAVPFAVVKKFGEDQAGNLAALVAYYSFFSIFPLLLVFVTVVGFVLQDNVEAQTKLLDSALSQFPIVGDQIKDNMGAMQGNGLALLIGVLAALWGGLGAID